jgi:hypothetical protein
VKSNYVSNVGGSVPTGCRTLCTLLQDLYRVLVTSLQQSSAQFQALTFEALTLGLWGLSSAHAELRDDIQGRTLGLQDRSVLGTHPSQEC